jgi:hypothetical protein
MNGGREGKSMSDTKTAAGAGRSKIILALAAWFALSALAALVQGMGKFGAMDGSVKLEWGAGVLVTLIVAAGLFLHRRWAMWLYFVYAAVGLAMFLMRGPNSTALFIALTLGALIIPGILIWIRRDQLRGGSAEGIHA